MNNNEFEQFVLDCGKDILRFCRMTCGTKESGDELYQDTMLKLLEKLSRLDPQQNVKSYALSISILLWKNKKKKYANRDRLMPMDSIDQVGEVGVSSYADNAVISPESIFLQEEEKETVQAVVSSLPERYRLPIYLYYSSNLTVREIAEILQIPMGTVKSRIYNAKRILKKELEAIGYDR